MNDKTTARRLVLVSVLVMVGAILARTAKGEVGKTFPRMWSLSVIAIILAVVADFAPQIAGPLALLVALSYLSHGGQKALAKVVTTGAKQNSIRAKIGGGISVTAG